MNGFLRFHEIAAQRGDGLRPELLALLQRRRAEMEVAEMLDNIVVCYPVRTAAPTNS